MVLDLNALKQPKVSETAVAIMGWTAESRVYRPPHMPGMIVPVITISLLDTLEREHEVSLPPDMIVPFAAALLSWMATAMGGSAPQTPVEDGSDG